MIIIKNLSSTVLFLMIALASSASSNANTPNEQIVAKVASAYGGDKLTSIEAITIHYYRKHLFNEQSGPQQTPDFWRFNEELTIDFVNQRKALLSWRVNSTNKDLEKFIASKTAGNVYDIIHKRHMTDDWYNYNNTGKSLELTSDTLLAKKLLLSKNKFTLVGQENYKGSLHFVVTFTGADENNSKIYIDQRSGLINKVSRIHPSAGELTYAFSNHAKIGQIAFARDMEFLIENQPQVVSTFRQIDPTPNLVEKFSIPKGTRSWGEPLETKNMAHNKLAENVYHVGKGRSRTIFIDAGDYFISTGGDGALANNFSSLQHHLETNKPLKFAVLSHHHRRQLNMIEPALKLGAKIVTVENNITAINKKLKREVNAEDIILVNQALNLLKGKVTIFDVATAHADQNLVVYLNKEKILYAEDHYEVLYQSGQPRTFYNMKVFANKIENLGIDIETLVNGSSPRILSISEFKKAAGAFSEPVCPSGYNICENG